MANRSSPPLRIGIHAAFGAAGEAGGVEQVVIGLVHALGKLADGDEEYVVLVRPEGTPWLAPYLGRNQRMQPYPGSAASRRSALGRVVPGRIREVRDAVRERALRALWGASPGGARVFHKPPESSGFIESLGLAVIHFPFQHFFHSRVPSIFTPWDLQHLHMPHFFEPEQVAAREMYYPVACRAASACVAASEWIKQDLVSKYAVDPRRIQIIPIAPPTESYAQLRPGEAERATHALGLPGDFAFYPAQTWPHKNHLRLLEAIAVVRDRHGLRVNLVCTGRKNEHWPRIAEAIDRLALQSQVQFLGFVETAALRGIYARASFVVLPTLFEGGCLPMLEAFRERVPVACSTVTHLPQLAGGAAHLFDATAVDSIADAVKRLATDAAYRDELKQRASSRVDQFTWERSARVTRALYRRLAGRTLSSEDLDLLQAPFPGQGGLG